MIIIILTNCQIGLVWINVRYFIEISHYRNIFGEIRSLVSCALMMFVNFIHEKIACYELLNFNSNRIKQLAALIESVSSYQLRRV